MKNWQPYEYELTHDHFPMSRLTKSREELVRRLRILEHNLRMYAQLSEEIEKACKENPNGLPF